MRALSRTPKVFVGRTITWRTVMLSNSSAFSNNSSCDGESCPE